jgi:molybdopterin/thiamine biosynthesis adenylyltransferase
MVRPCLKQSYTRLVANGEITLTRETGVEMTLPDPDGQVLALLDLLDGDRTIDEVSRAMAERWPGLTADDVAEGIAALDGAGLLEDAAAPTTLSAWQRERYSSNLAFFGTFADLTRSRDSFQEALRRAHVVLLGVGGLGSTLLLNLAGLGVGQVTVLDCDRVELKNLARQFLYSEAEVGQPKLGRAVARARAFNSEVRLTPVERWVTGPEDVAPLLPGADLVLSAIDQPPEVQEWVNEACVAAGVPFITGGIQAGRGLYYLVIPGRSSCLACWRDAEAPAGATVTPAGRPERVNRALGPAASLMGALIALEAVRYLTGFAPPVSAAKLWLVDFATGRSDVGYAWPRLPDCPVCGPEASAGARGTRAGAAAEPSPAAAGAG